MKFLCSSALYTLHSKDISYICVWRIHWYLMLLILCPRNPCGFHLDSMGWWFYLYFQFMEQKRRKWGKRTVTTFFFFFPSQENVTKWCLNQCSLSFIHVSDHWLTPCLSSTQCTCQFSRHKRGRFDPWVGKIPWRRAWQPPPNSCLENPMDRGAWWATVHSVTRESDMTEQLTLSTFFFL